MVNPDTAYWSDKQAIDKFATKKSDAFFQSERFLLSQITDKFETVLDVGCGSGRLQEILGDYTKDFAYTGIDISDALLDHGRNQYKQATFEHTDILNYRSKDRFNLVYAIGFLQHVPETDKIIDRFWNLSDRYMLFDFKSTSSGKSVCDKELSYCERNGERVHFVLIDMGNLLNQLYARGAKSTMMWSYETPLNAYTHVPDGCGAIQSTTLLVEIPHDTHSGDS